MLNLATIFTDHMVLQANKPIKIFGEGEGSAKIEFLGNTYEAYGTGGKWCVSAPAMPYGGPYEMSFESEGAKTVIRDIYIGEVWFASGQSNMEMPLFRVDGGLMEAKHAENNLIRFFLKTFLNFFGNGKHWCGTEGIPCMYTDRVNIFNKTNSNHVIVCITNDF